MELILSEEEKKKFAEWNEIHKHICPCYQSTTIGGRFTFQKIPTGLGDIDKVVCACGEELIFTDSSNW